MKKYFMALLTALVLTFLTISATSAQVKKTEDASGLLYKISGKDLKKPSYLFGTIHVVCPSDMFSMEKLGGYIDQTDQLVMELDMDNTAEMAVMGQGLVIPGGKTLRDYLTADEFAKVDEMFKKYLGYSVENIKQIKPSFTSIIFATAPKTIGCTPGSYEMSLLKAATEKKKGIEGLETVASQFAVFEKIPLEKQAKSLYEISLDPQKTIDGFKKLVEAYKAQNVETLHAYLVEQMKTEKEFQGVLLDDRNRDWIPKIEKMIVEKPSFIAVGGGHLGGKNGVLSLLKAKGYKIEAIKL